MSNVGRQEKGRTSWVSEEVVPSIPNSCSLRGKCKEAMEQVQMEQLELGLSCVKSPATRLERKQGSPTKR